MRYNTLLFVILLLICSQAFPQDAAKVTTFIVVRHAEKSSDGSKDPELTAEGSARANKLSDMLKEVSVRAIFSTNYKRTRNTVTPLAIAKKIDIQFYESFKGKDIEDILKKYPGGTIVICGHSNTVPSIVNQLVDKNQFSDLDDSDYSNLFIVSVIEKGKITGVTRLRY